jgi:putative peptidoglycan lipid II flippase
VRKILFGGGGLLAMSAVTSKLLGLLRDRLLVSIFESGDKIDFVFAAFRIPDFFFFLLVGGTVTTLFLPRAALLKGKDRTQFFSSFLWGVMLLFGVLCGVGAIFPEFLVRIFVSGFETTAQSEIATLSRLLFGSVFFLGISSVFSAKMQLREKFLSVAMAPLFYTGTICVGLWFFGKEWGLVAVGMSAIAGAMLHACANAFAYFWDKGKIGFFWRKPKSAWENFGSDFVLRTTNNAAFQVNQSADVWIASFLTTGAVSAFSFGTNVGHVLLSILGFPVAHSVFPRFTKAKHQYAAQKKVLLEGIGMILCLTVPVAIVGFVWSREILHLLFNISGDMLDMGAMVLRWTIVSSPFACLTPVLSRLFLANDDVKTPTKISGIVLLVATGIAVFFSLYFFERGSIEAIRGLAIGNFVANTLSATLFLFIAWKKFFRTIK